MEGLFYLLGVVLCFCVLFWLKRKQDREYNEELLRREKITNALCDISGYLEEIKKRSLV